MKVVFVGITWLASNDKTKFPLNTIHTMNSKEMVNKFALDADSTLFVKKIEGIGNPVYTTTKELKNGMHRVEQELKKIGYDAQLYASVIYFLTYKQKDSEDYSKIMTIQVQENDGTFLEYEEGSAPILENEVAFSRQVMEEHGWHIGDHVDLLVEDHTYDMIITATYSDYMQLGVSARLNAKLALSIPMFEYWNVNVRMNTALSSEEVKAQLQQQLPAYEWCTAQEIVDRSVGGIRDILKELLLPMTGMLCGVIMLITLLMEKLFIVREKGEIAMMKSIGLRYGTIRIWQLCDHRNRLYRAWKRKCPHERQGTKGRRCRKHAGKGIQIVKLLEGEERRRTSVDDL